MPPAEWSLRMDSWIGQVVDFFRAAAKVDKVYIVANISIVRFAHDRQQSGIMFQVYVTDTFRGFGLFIMIQAVE